MTQEGGGWTLVGRIPRLATGLPTTPPIQTWVMPTRMALYEPNPNSGSHFLHRRDQLTQNGEIMFAYGDWSYWAWTRKRMVFRNLRKQLHQSEASNLSSNGGCYRWYNRGSGNPEDPWIGVGDHDEFLVWGENHSGGQTSITYKNNHGGVTVWVR